MYQCAALYTYSICVTLHICETSGKRLRRWANIVQMLFSMKGKTTLNMIEHLWIWSFSSFYELDNTTIFQFIKQNGAYFAQFVDPGSRVQGRSTILKTLYESCFK